MNEKGIVEELLDARLLTRPIFGGNVKQCVGSPYATTLVTRMLLNVQM